MRVIVVFLLLLPLSAQTKTAGIEHAPKYGYLDAEDDEQPTLALKAEESVTYDDMQNEQWRVTVTAEQPVIISGPCGDSAAVLHEVYKCSRAGEFTITDARSKLAGAFAAVVGAHAQDATASNRLYMPNKVELRFAYWGCLRNCVTSAPSPTSTKGK